MKKNYRTNNLGKFAKKGSHLSFEIREKIRKRTKEALSLKPRKIITVAHREKLSKALLGTKQTIAHRLSVSKSLLGSKNPRWRGGITNLRKQIRECFQYRQWRSDIFTRDSFACVLCGDKTGGNLNADHFPKSFSTILGEYSIKNLEEAVSCSELWNINNGRTLCIPCHKETPNYLKRRPK